MVVYWLGHWTCDLMVASSFTGYRDWVPPSGGQTTSVFHQATRANSVSYPQRDGKWVPAKMWWWSAAGE